MSITSNENTSGEMVQILKLIPIEYVIWLQTALYKSTRMWLSPNYANHTVIYTGFHRLFHGRRPYWIQNGWTESFAFAGQPGLTAFRDAQIRDICRRRWGGWCGRRRIRSLDVRCVIQYRWNLKCRLVNSGCCRPGKVYIIVGIDGFGRIMGWFVAELDIWAFKDTRIHFGGRQHTFPERLNMSHLNLPFIDVPLCVIVHPQACARERNTKSLHCVNWLLEPYDGHANDSYAFDKRCDRIGNGGCWCQQCKCNDALGKVNSPIEKKIKKNRSSIFGNNRIDPQIK